MLASALLILAAATPQAGANVLAVARAQIVSGERIALAGRVTGADRQRTERPVYLKSEDRSVALRLVEFQ
jgi:hypothetical protein